MAAFDRIFKEFAATDARQESGPRRDLRTFWRVYDDKVGRPHGLQASEAMLAHSTGPRRAHFQHLADLVFGHAAEQGWPKVTYQAAFISVVHPGTATRTLEGNSIFWKSDWDAQGDCTDHPVNVRSGEQAWRVFSARALYPDLLRADAALQEC